MAGSLIQRGNQPNTNICEYVVDTVDEIAYLPTTTKPASGIFKDSPDMEIKPPIGSTCIVGNGTNEVKVYMLFSEPVNWKEI